MVFLPDTSRLALREKSVRYIGRYAATATLIVLSAEELRRSSLLWERIEL